MCTIPISHPEMADWRRIAPLATSTSRSTEPRYSPRSHPREYSLGSHSRHRSPRPRSRHESPDTHSSHRSPRPRSRDESYTAYPQAKGVKVAHLRKSRVTYLQLQSIHLSLSSHADHAAATTTTHTPRPSIEEDAAPFQMEETPCQNEQDSHPNHASILTDTPMASTEEHNYNTPFQNISELL